MEWHDHQKWESDWWEGAINTYQEESKQIAYAKRMGLEANSVNGKFPVYDLGGVSVLDIGGGPVSLLLKCKNRGASMVIDPCEYPMWTIDRYSEALIGYQKKAGEDINPKKSAKYDEVWIYNVLQHVQDPAKIIKNARAVGKIIRLFEWVDLPPQPGHPHMLTEKSLNEWLGGVGKVEDMNELGAVGRAYYGVFKGDLYEQKV